MLSFIEQISDPVPSLHVRVNFCIPGPHDGNTPVAMHAPSMVHFPNTFGQFDRSVPACLQDIICMESSAVHISIPVPLVQLRFCCWTPGPQLSLLFKGLQRPTFSQRPYVLVTSVNKNKISVLLHLQIFLMSN